MSRVDDILVSVPLASILPPDLNMVSIGRDRLRGDCPIQHHNSRRTLAVSLHADGHQIWQCFACNKRGSVIDLFAALNNLTVAAAIRKLSEKNLEPVSRDVILRRAYDAIERQRPGYAYLACDIDGCGSMLLIDTELDLAIICAGGSWLWKASPTGRTAICHKHDWSKSHWTGDLGQ